MNTLSRRSLLAVGAAGTVAAGISTARAGSFGNPDNPPEGAIATEALAITIESGVWVDMGTIPGCSASRSGRSDALGRAFRDSGSWRQDPTGIRIGQHDISGRQFGGRPGRFIGTCSPKFWTASSGIVEGISEP